MNNGARWMPRASPPHPRLFAAGSLLAHQDWMRQRYGAGVAIATAYKAVDAAVQAARSSQAQRNRTQ